VPKPRKPPSKFGNSDTPEPIPELEKPEPPKAEFPKPELPKLDPPKRVPPKFPKVRPEEDEDEVNLVDAGEFVEKRCKSKPWPERRAFNGAAWFPPKDENPELFRPNETLLEFPNERHWPSFLTKFP
jgi:hypothetical protein